MDFESTYTSPRDEALKALSGIGNTQRFAVRKDALALAEEKQARAFGYAAAPQAATSEGQSRWYAALLVLFAIAVFGGMALLMAMGTPR